MLTRQAARKLEKARDDVEKGVDRCMKQEDKYSELIDVSWKDLNKANDMLLQFVNNFLDKYDNSLDEMISDGKHTNEMIRLRISFMQEILHSIRHFAQLCGQAIDRLIYTLGNFHRTTNMLNSIQSRIDTMTLEEAENIIYPDYLWAVNNFHPNYYHLEDDANDLGEEIEQKTKIYEESASKLYIAEIEKRKYSAGPSCAKYKNQNLAKEMNCDE